MAVKTFDEIYASLSAEEKTLLDNTTKKYPELKEGWLRQDDYSRNMNSLKAQEAEIDEIKTYNEQMKTWAEKNVPKWQALEEKGIVDKETGDELWTGQKAELERQLDEAKKAAVGGENMDPKELDRRVTEIVKANGGLTPDELKNVIASQAKALAEETFKTQWAEKETSFNEKTIPFVAGFSTANTIAALKYEKATGQEWNADTQKKFYEHMSAKKNFDPYAVIDEFVEPMKKGKETATEIENLKAENARLKAGRGMPGDGHEEVIPQNRPKGALELMLERSQEGGDFESVIKTQAVKAAQQLQTEGKT